MSVINPTQRCVLEGTQKRVWIAPSEIAAGLEVKLAREQEFLSCGNKMRF